MDGEIQDSDTKLEAEINTGSRGYQDYGHYDSAKQQSDKCRNKHSDLGLAGILLAYPVEHFH